jgi:hypothetical protein
MVRPPCLPVEASRLIREPVDLGNIPYSAVTQPSPLPLRKGGTLLSTDAVHKTRVLPQAINTDPSA